MNMLLFIRLLNKKGRLDVREGIVHFLGRHGESGSTFIVFWV